MDNCSFGCILSWCNPYEYWCCKNNGADQGGKDNENQKQSNPLVEEEKGGEGAVMSAPKSGSMQRFTNLRY
jgi:hypothetical protein